MPLVAVTGSNGKTTVKEMIASILRAWRSASTRARDARATSTTTSACRSRCFGLRDGIRARGDRARHEPRGETPRCGDRGADDRAREQRAARAPGIHGDGRGGRARDTQRRSHALGATASLCSTPTTPTRRIWREIAATAQARSSTSRCDGAADVVGPGRVAAAIAGRVTLQTPRGRGDARAARAGRHNVRNALAATAAALAAGVPLDAIVRGLRRLRAGRAAARSAALRRVERRSARSSTTPTTPIPIRCAPRSTCSPRCRRRAGSCWATWARSATRARRFIARSAPTRRSAASTRSGRSGARARSTATPFGRRARIRQRRGAARRAAASAPRGASVLVKGSRFMRMERSSPPRRRARGCARRDEPAPDPRRGTRPARTIGEPHAACLAQWLQPTSPSSASCASSATSPSAPCCAAMTLARHRPRVRPVGDPPARRRSRSARPCATTASQSHLVKSGTPTMGGVLILLGIGVTTLLWADLVEPLRVDRDAGDARLRRDRLGRRLAQGRAQEPARACRRARSSSGNR